LTVEDHHLEGGLGEAVCQELSDMPTPVHCAAVRRRPRSGPPETLRAEQGISARAIVDLIVDLASWEPGRVGAGSAGG
jgi:transketolase C-terminal domain/subunit